MAFGQALTGRIGHERAVKKTRRRQIQGAIQQELPRDGLSGAPGGFGGPRNEEAPAALQTLRCALGDDYLWHSGTALSSSVPQMFNQVRTS